MEQDASAEQTTIKGLEGAAVGTGEPRSLYHTCAIFVLVQ